MTAATAIRTTASSFTNALAAGFRLRVAFVGCVAMVAVTSAASAENRTLDLYNNHTRERLTITFKKDGRYIPAALNELNRFLRDWRRNEATRMDPRLFDTVWEVYQKSGSRQPIHIVSGYRALATNNMLRSRSSAVAKHSQHTLGKAMDINIPDVSIDKLRMIAVKMQNGGVGWYPTSGTPFVHVDVGSVRAWPRLTRTQLVGLFPDGKTAHIPSDGKPLPGYREALAEIQREKGSAPVAMASASSSGGSKGGGLLAMLFSGGEEDASDEISAASDDDEAPATATARAPVAPAAPAAIAPVAPAIAAPAPAIVQPAPAAPVLTAAFAPRPMAAPDRPVTSLADATLPAGLEPAAVPQISGADRLAMDTVPLPQAKPSEIAEVPMALAMTDVPVMLPPDKPAAPIEAPLPIAAARHDDAIAAQLALAEVAQEPAAPEAALSFAPPVADSKPLQVAALPPSPAGSKPAARPAAPAAITGNLSRPIVDGGKSDMLASVELPEITSEDGPLLLDGNQSVYWGKFRALSHPDQRNIAALFEAPAEVVNATFSASPYGALVSTRFGGPMQPQNDIVQFTPRQLAMR